MMRDFSMLVYLRISIMLGVLGKPGECLWILWSELVWVSVWGGFGSPIAFVWNRDGGAVLVSGYDASQSRAVGSWAGKVAQQSALFPYGSLSAWCRVSLVRRCFLPPDAAPHFVHLHHGAPGAVSLSCLGAPSVPESPPKRQVICECDRFFRWPCILNRTGVLL